jgi:hypothetical protein
MHPLLPEPLRLQGMPQHSALLQNQLKAIPNCVPISEPSTLSLASRKTWLQERLATGDMRVIELAKRFPKVHNLSIKEQFKPTLDWMQASIGSSDEKLAKLSWSQQWQWHVTQEVSTKS